MLFILNVLAFGRGVTGDFIYDDFGEIKQNANIRSWSPLWKPIEKNKLPVRPIPYLTFAVNYSIHGYYLPGYHLFNMSIHLVTAWVIYLLLYDVIQKKKFAGEDSFQVKLIAGSIALLWMIHPLQTQPVNYIYQRIELMMSMFFMLTLYFFNQSVNSEKKWRVIYFIISLSCCACGMLCKEVMFVAPIAVLWFDRAILANSWKEVFSLRGKQHLLLFLSWIILFGLMASQDYPEYKKGEKELATPLEYLLTESEVLVQYLRLIIYPQPLIFDYHWPVRTSLEQVMLPGIFIVILLVGVVYLIYSKPELGFVSGWFFLLLGVTSSIYPVLQPICEHRLHLALLGPVTLFVIMIFKILKYTGIKNGKAATGVIICGLAICFIVLSSNRSAVYADYDQLWKDTAEKQPGFSKPLYQLGSNYLEHKNYVQAEHYLRQALDLDSEKASYWNRLGMCYLEQGEIVKAVSLYEESYQKHPRDIDILNNYGVLLAMTEKYEMAEKVLLESLKINNHNRGALFNLSRLYLRTGRHKIAANYLKQAIAYFPDENETKQLIKEWQAIAKP